MKNTILLLGGVLAVFILAFVGYAVLGETEEVVYIDDERETEVRKEMFEEPEVVAEPEEMTVVVKEAECVLIEDFNGESDLRWYTVNDGVMGGLSDGFASIQNNRLIHEGEIVTRGGGFSYVGTRLPDDALVGYSRLQVRLNTNGRAYAANFADSRSWRVTHQVAIPVGEGNEWQEVSVDFADTVPTIFSRQVNASPFDAGSVEELAFILSDGVDGAFRTEIDWVRVCR